MSKLFDNMSDLEFAQTGQLDNPKVAVGMYSKEREYVPFQTDCRCTGPVRSTTIESNFLSHLVTNGKKKQSGIRWRPGS